MGAHLLKEVYSVDETPDYNEIIDRLGLDYLKPTTSESEAKECTKAG
jgi:hypothetical protein